jgi:hypothetical protein
MMGFAEFCERLLRVTFTPAQWALFAVQFDGIEPGRLDGERREFARQLFGDIDTVPPSARRVAVLVKGARIGGTRFSMTRLVHLAATLKLPPLAPGEAAYALVIGPDTRLARQALGFALGSMQSHPDLSDRVQNVTSDSFEFVRDDGVVVIFTCLPATAGGSAVRGRTLVGAVMTEAAFFRDASAVINDSDIYRALLPRIVPGGQLIIESTPWAEMGLLWQLFDANFGTPTAALVARCPTLTMRPDPATEAFVASERLRDPDSAAREFDTAFLAAGALVFLDPKAVDAMVDDDLKHPVPFDPDAGKASSGDFGFVSDSSALTIVQTKDANAQAWLALVDELAPQPGAPLQPSVVARRFASQMRNYQSRELICDSHYVESVREHVEPFRVHLFPAPSGAQGKLDVHVAARELIYEKKIRIPRIPRLLLQLKGLISRPVPGGGMRIEFPRRRGLAHGDIASAFMLACWAIKVQRASPADRARWDQHSLQIHYAGMIAAGGMPPELMSLPEGVRETALLALQNGRSTLDEILTPAGVQIAYAGRAWRDSGGVERNARAHNDLLRRQGSPAAMTDEQLDAHFRARKPAPADDAKPWVPPPGPRDLPQHRPEELDELLMKRAREERK